MSFSLWKGKVSISGRHDGGRIPVHKLKRKNMFFKGNTYNALKKIGSGSFGTVHMAKSSLTDEYVARKRIDIEKYSLSNGIREVAMLYFLQGAPNIVPILDWGLTPRLEQLFVVTKLGDLSIDDAIKEEDMYFTLPMIRTIMFRILETIAFLHAHNLHHRDLKSHNVILTFADEEKKIIKDVHVLDFGSSRCRAGRHVSHLDTTCTATLSFRAPEVIIDKATDQSYFTLDVWGAACIMAEMIKEDRFFDVQTSEDMLLLSMKRFGTPTEESWPDHKRALEYHEFCDLFAVGETGMPMKELFPDSLFLDAATEDDMNTMRDLLGKMFTMNPAKRITAREALMHPFFDGMGKPRDTAVKTMVPWTPPYSVEPFEASTAFVFPSFIIDASADGSPPIARELLRRESHIVISSFTRHYTCEDDFERRSYMVHWLILAKQKMLYLSRTFFVAIDIMDRFFSCKKISVDWGDISERVHCAAACMFIAGEMEEMYPEVLSDYGRLFECDLVTLRQWVHSILERNSAPMLVSCTSPHTYISIMMRKVSEDMHAKGHTLNGRYMDKGPHAAVQRRIMSVMDRYLMHVSTTRLFSHTPSRLAAAVWFCGLDALRTSLERYPSLFRPSDDDDADDGLHSATLVFLKECPDTFLDTYNVADGDINDIRACIDEHIRSSIATRETRSMPWNAFEVMKKCNDVPIIALAKYDIVETMLSAAPQSKGAGETGEYIKTAFDIVDTSQNRVLDICRLFAYICVNMHMLMISMSGKFPNTILNKLTEFSKSHPMYKDVFRAFKIRYLSVIDDLGYELRVV